MKRKKVGRMVNHPNRFRLSIGIGMGIGVLLNATVLDGGALTFVALVLVGFLLGKEIYFKFLDNKKTKK